MNVGYARVSSPDQKEERQIRAFKDAGIEKIYIDKQSGKSVDRPQLREMLSFIRDGDVVTVESISRIARNTKDLLSIVETINSKGAEFISQKEQLDTRTATGKFMLTVFGAMAELEREYIHSRQAEGIAIAKEQHKYKGKQKIPIDQEKLKHECKRWRSGEQTAAETMRRLNIKPNTFYRRVKELDL